MSHEYHLTAACAYNSYSVTLTAEIQLRDIDPPHVVKKIVASNPDSAAPSRRVAVKVGPTSPHEIRQRSGLEPPNLERDLSADVQLVVKRRFYAPRIRPGAAR